MYALRATATDVLFSVMSLENVSILGQLEVIEGGRARKVQEISMRKQGW